MASAIGPKYLRSSDIWGDMPLRDPPSREEGLVENA
jgi:hypothetical protein